MWGASEFGPDFQRILVRTAVDDPELRALVKRFIESKQLAFTDPASAWAWRVLAAMEYPTMLAIGTESRRLDEDDPARLGVEGLLNAKDWRDLDYARTKIFEWARRQIFKAAFEEARTEWNTGDFDKAMDVVMRRIEEINGLSMMSADRGWFFTEFDTRQQRRSYVAEGEDYFPTGIARIDKAMHGGLSYTELGVPMAYAKIGKSFFCVQQGGLCARSRRRCLHAVLEGSRAQTEDRYESYFLSTLYREIRKGDIAEEVAMTARREYAILRDNLVVRAWGDQGGQWRVTYDMILAELAHLRQSKGWVPDMVIIDYGDLMHAPGDSEYLKQKTAFRQLKALAQRQEFPGHRGYAVWAPTQAQRPSASADEREHILRPRDIADSYEKVRVCDAIITLNRTNREKEYNQARVHLGAYRDAEDGCTVRVTTDYSNGRFCVPFESTEPPPPPAREAA